MVAEVDVGGWFRECAVVDAERAQATRGRRVARRFGRSGHQVQIKRGAQLVDGGPRDDGERGD